MSTTTIRCCQCKRITGLVSDSAVPYGGRTVETFQPCYSCVAEARLLRAKAAAIRSSRRDQAVPA